MTKELPVIPGFPRGWKIIEAYQQTGTPRLWIVLCEKTDNRPHDEQYVTWRADTEGGGCYWGHYNDDLGKAREDFASRVLSHGRE